MSIEKETFKKCELVCRIFEGDVSPEEFQAFEKDLSQDLELLHIYTQVAEFYGHFICPGMPLNFQSVSSQNDEFALDMKFWEQLLEQERTAETIRFPEKPQMELIQKVVYPPREKRKLSKFNIFTFVMSGAAILLLVLFLKFAPKPVSAVEVATLIDQMDVQWGQSHAAIPNNSRLWTNEGTLELKKGLVSIRYDDGVGVVIEGPAAFEIERTGLFLEYGRLYSRVAEAGIGFTVKTPTSQFIDLGTEFGIHAEVNGSSEVHVIKGKVQLFAGSDGRSKTGQIVQQDHALRYNANNDQVKNISVEKTAFVRHIDEKAGVVWRGQGCSLANIVGGGKGFDAGITPLAVDPDDGKLFQGNSHRQRFGENRFVQTDYSQYVDGVFIPDARKGDVVVSSAGHIFKDCPATDGDTTFNICNFSPFRDAGGTKIAMIHNNIEYGSGSHRAIMMHSNAGLTFDLAAIRQSIPSETTVIGLKTRPTFSEVIKEVWPRAEFWILVDGQTRFTKLMTPGMKSEEVIIPLTQADRFLTLVVTDGGNALGDNTVSHSNDHCFWVDPILEIQ